MYLCVKELMRQHLNWGRGKKKVRRKKNVVGLKAIQSWMGSHGPSLLSYQAHVEVGGERRYN